VHARCEASLEIAVFAQLVSACEAWLIEFWRPINVQGGEWEYRGLWEDLALLPNVRLVSSLVVSDIGKRMCLVLECRWR
jgi:hypothetical protein